MSVRVWPGRPFPLGATWDGNGTNFSLFSEHAERVELCLFDEADRETRVDLRERTALNWHGFLPDVRPGQRYAYRVHGPWDPAKGHRFNPHKLLIDPYAKAIEGAVAYDAANVLPYEPDGEDADLVRDETDDADAIPRSIVVDPGFDWEGDRHLNTPWHETVIYEVHVKGFTARHPGVREDLRGTYAGLASDAAIEHLRALGVTAVELLPVHHIADEAHLASRGLTNYWGYSSIGYLAPHALYAATGQEGEQVREFKGMVKALHRAGIEVILDVVYNHTAEGNHLGPMLSFKGIDNLSYYRCSPDDPRHYVDFTGTGNSLNPVHPSVLRLIMDSLRYWVTEMHVDGFRFDLASALAREFWEVNRLSAFFDIIHQDPVLSQVKLIAEPWDVGPGGYQVGNFPVLWTEWNGVYRDEMRDFWRAQSDGVAEFASRLTGSSDLYQSDGRRPFASINFITAHDGFTLNDLVSYNGKHNEANREDNRDGTDDNRSWNCGAEGPTDDAQVLELRARQRRNFLATLLLSQGVPMLLGGDEMGRTQSGNNNAYCQDNGISWFDWELDEEQRAVLAFAQRLIALRAAHPVFRRRDFFGGADGDGSGLPDIRWFREDGREMSRRDWRAGDRRVLGVFLNGEEIPSPSPEGERVVDDSFVLLVNAGHEPAGFRLPARRFGNRWQQVMSTAGPEAADDEGTWPARGEVPLEARSMLLLRRAGVRATYRLQLGPGMGFARARELVPYLRDLGVSHLYLSPALQARRGSTHGYDVTDPRRISDDLGGEAAFRELAAAGLGVVLDIVPNHMAASDENPFWADERLRERFFDIDPETGRHRRFFSIDELAGVRQEDPEVFDTTHALVLGLVAEGVVDGLRIDHPDGLADPPEYLRRLAARGVERAWVEKILEPGEELPDWPVEGTTGYEFMADATGLFIDPAGEAPLTALYAEIAGERRPFAAVADEAKRQEARTTFRPEVDRLRTLLDDPGMADAVAGLPVYRTYVEPQAGEVEPHDAEAVAEAELPARVREALVAPSDPDEEAFAIRFQQTTGAVMAKGVEDTALYRYLRLAALNEVGSDPGRWGASPAEVHARNAARAERFPRGLLATQTHDTKRSGDARARIGALSGMAGAWRERVLRWRAMNAPLREGAAPSAAEEYLLYQTLAGAWPLERERLVDYMIKAIREAKVTTDWTDPDEEHERAVRRFVAGLYRSDEFLADLEAFVAELAPRGEEAALGQTLLKLTAPGVPDIYQGDELWCLSLVDPDNRRPVDWDRRRRLLSAVLAGAAPTREAAKLLLIHRALALRARRPEPFAGAYRPLDAGERAFAYARGDAVIAAMPIREGGADERLEIPDDLRGLWRDALGHREVELGPEARLGELSGALPVALLERP